ncbi:MAG: DNA repair protein RadA [Candidatus Epulonipiscioides saccharophilum]|nr:MAG: DNA repair protein RadA [Epulopiscium sp. AS2M-Bin001]
MSKIKTVYVCQSCGYESAKWLGKCPSCQEWSSMIEETIQETKNKNTSTSDGSIPVKLAEIILTEENRITTGLDELDRVLGGGLVQGSLILVGGDPGIGKSTLLLQICQTLGELNNKVLYISGEESCAQIKLRAQRLQVDTNNLFLLSEIIMSNIQTNILKHKPKLVIIDSIQTMYDSDIASAPGSVSQVRQVTHTLMQIAKSYNITIFIVGHVTKEGSLAGPRVLEHMVDTVLYFEGERHASFRILRAVKNRFGSTNEIGVFEMIDKGLVEVKNPSELMLSGRALNCSGSIVSCGLEGTRPMLIEIQALTSPTKFGMPRRTSTGFDYNRMVVLIAVLEKRLGFNISSQDVYVNITGGLKINEPALDLAVVFAITSSFKNKILDPYIVVFGEVGLSGEIRAISMPEKRILEAKKLGFKCTIIPHSNKIKLPQIDGIEIIGVDRIDKAMSLI